MKCRFLIYFLMLVLTLGTQRTWAQNWFDNIIQINGVTMTADSLRGVAGVEVIVKNKNRGVESSPSGVFTIVCYKGDTLQFSALGFRGKEYVIKKEIKGQYFSLVQLMVQDTFYLPETIIRPLPDKDHFAYAFRYWHIPNDQYEIARRNTDKYTLRALAYTLPHDGREAQAIAQQDQANKAVYYGQQPPMNILNPLAWGDFFEAWKRGDFRNQNQQQNNY
jgi:hypothetical protein